MITEAYDATVTLEQAATLETVQVAGQLNVDLSLGLKTAEAATRLAHWGPNAIPMRQPSGWRILARQFRSPLLMLLLGAAALSAALGDPNDAIIIGVIVVLSSGLGFYHEYRAVGVAQALHDQIQHSTVARRDGVATTITVADVVPGDIVTIKLGDVVPADLRLITTTELECDESVLTGEGAPVEKSAAPVAAGLPLAELGCCALAGTVVSSGSGVGVVVATGPHSKFGAIAAGLGTAEVETSFQAGLRRFSMFLVYVGGTLTAAIFGINLVLHKPFIDALLFSLAIAVGITPQLLPVVVSTSLATGSARMARVKVLVKRLVCIEDLGDVSMLFTDKTGTLTRGALDFGRAIPTGEHTADDLIHLGLLATESEATEGQAVGGNLLDQALWSTPRARSAQLLTWTRVAVLPFDHERRMVSVVARRADGTTHLISKGAPESILERCSNVPDQVHAQLAAEFSQGSRVVAVATRDLAPDWAGRLGAADEEDLQLAGLLVFLDPPKADAQRALQRLRELGIDVKVVTGDNPLVALKVCHDLGLPDAPALTGPQIAAMSDAELDAAIPTTTVFARVSPEDKARIVKSGRRLVGGVAFLGDGVNDALALHGADIGISVDSATDVAKDAADVILLEKDLEVLADGVVEGRRIFANTIKYVMMGTSSNFGNMFSAAGASIFLPFLPMLPSQILLNNLLYDTSQLAIPTDQVDQAQLLKPSHWDIGFIRRFMLIFGPLSSIFDFATFGVLMWAFHADEAMFQTGWFVESLATQALVIFAVRTRRIPFFRSRPSLAIIVSTLTVVAVGALLPLTPLAAMMHFAALPWQLYVVIGAMVLIYLALVEGGKAVFYRTLATGPTMPASAPPPRPATQHLARRRRWFTGPPTASPRSRVRGR